MKITKTLYAVLIALSACPVAYAQLITSQHGQAQRGATADSTTEITGGAPTKAPTTSIGSGTAQGSSAAQQSYEVRVDICPAGFSGTREFRRKIYIRESGSRFEEAWYMTNDACVQSRDPAIAALETSIRVLSDRLIAVENKPTPTPGGGATPVFAITRGQFMGTTEGGSVTGYCVSSGYANWGNYTERDIVISNVWNIPGVELGPWTGWPARQVGPRTYVGPICPPGMGFTTLTNTQQDPQQGE
ncbi:MAG: hypothetical protein EON54_03405 [Alcaligenaceae bacterium]|nr:MAG: hypothetical protein EON54_03405 [Alcaligenaceae bacterium]